MTISPENGTFNGITAGIDKELDWSGLDWKVRCLFLMPFVAVIALHLLLVPTTHMEGPVLLLPMIRKVRRRYALPSRCRRNNQQDPAPHNYRMWRPGMLLLYFACFFHTPTAPSTGVPTHYYHAPVPSTSVISPHNTRYNNKWVLQCGDVHPNPGTGGYTSSDATAASYQDPPSLDVTTTQERDMKLVTWNIQGAQGSVTLPRRASVLHPIKQCRIDLCGIQEYNPCFPLPEAATTALNNDYKCYAAPGNEPRAAFLIRNNVVTHVLETLYSPNGLAGAIRLQLPNSPRRTIGCVYSKFSRQDKHEVDLFLHSLQPYDIIMAEWGTTMTTYGRRTRHALGNKT